MDDLISRKAVLELWEKYSSCISVKACEYDTKLRGLPSAQPEYEELTPEEAALEIASGSIMSARYWLDAMIQLKQMGYAICRKKIKGQI